MFAVYKSKRGKGHPRTQRESPTEDLRYSSTLSLTSALDEGGWSTPRPGRFTPERPGTHCIGGWVGPRAGVDGCEKSRLPLGFDLRTVLHVASRYTDSAITAHVQT